MAFWACGFSLTTEKDLALELEREACAPHNQRSRQGLLVSAGGRSAFHPINMQGKLMTQPDTRQIPGMKPSTDAALDLR